MLQTESAHANLLLEALNTLLSVDADADPFTGAFSALMPIFEASHAIVLAQEGDAPGFRCTTSNEPRLVGSLWSTSRTLTKVLNGRIITTLSVQDSAHWPQVAHECLSQSQPALYLPLGVRNRRGLLILLRRKDQPGFDRAHVALAGKFSLLASHAFAARHAHETEAESHRLKDLTTQLRNSQEALAHRANHDQLTGLPNRAYVKELISDALARKTAGERIAVAFIDLDNFKRVNDLHGHSVGDALLQGISERLRGMIRETDILGRISGDEFIVALDPCQGMDEIAHLADRISEQLQVPISVEGIEVKGAGSIGVAVYPEHGRDYETLRHNADTAMYQAKMAAKSGVEFYSQQLGQRLTERMRLEARLRNALARSEFKCALQAKVDLRTNGIAGFEALVRWVDSDGIVHAPGQFLQLAGELDLLDGIANLVLDELLEKLPLLDACFGRDLRYSLNISPVQASKPEFMTEIACKIAASGRSENFMLELTEESLLAAGVFQTEVLPLVRDMGIGISIDDFGTGFSSLSVLADITADELKIDRSFITSIHQRPRSQSILRAIESLSAALGISVVAEGVETPQEHDYLLHKSGIGIGQGYLFHKPQFIGDIVTGHRALLAGIATHPTLRCA